MPQKYHEDRCAIHFLWINLIFEKESTLLPQKYLEKLKNETTERKKANIKSPIFFVYRSGFLVKEDENKLKEIKNLGIYTVDYDKLVDCKNGIKILSD
jgi:hypothetical protein